MNKSVLYISYDGMTDPLGQSQVIPYLTGLADAGYNITILSCEKKDALDKHQDKINHLLSEKNISWAYSIYKDSPPVLSSFLNYVSLNRKAIDLHKQKKFSIVHCRSYISALIGMAMKTKFNTTFLFDMRGFWADERAEAGLWNLNNPLYNFIYRFFKKKEKEFLSHADHIVSLTEAGKKEIPMRSKGIVLPPISVIPCCADTKHFDPENKNYHDLSEKFRLQLKISENDFIITYLGALGTWYLLDEMLVFFQRLLLKKPNAKFLFITLENPGNIHLKARELNIPENKIIVRKAARAEVPALLLLSNFSVFFIKQCFSKIASSPTKMAEVMAMGIPIICNNKVGDVEDILNRGHCGVTVNTFSDQEYDLAISKLDNLLAIPPKQIREQALNLFSLELGIEKYKGIYESLTA